jgi:ribonuclease HI
MVWGNRRRTADKFIRSGIDSKLSDMTTTIPHYLLFSESTAGASSISCSIGGNTTGRWRIVLEAVDGSSKLEASDEEELPADRLELLAVIRGLEAIPQPARVTLTTPSDYVSRGLRFGLNEWRRNGWQWEHFGRSAPVANADLWQRLDRALRIHQVQCRSLRVDAAHRTLTESQPENSTSRTAAWSWMQERTKAIWNGMKGCLGRLRDPAATYCAS